MALTTFSDLVQEARERVKRDALAAGLPDDGKPLDDGGTGATAYADAVAVYLAFAREQGCRYLIIDCALGSSMVTHESRSHVRTPSDSDDMGLCRDQSALASLGGDLLMHRAGSLEGIDDGCPRYARLTQVRQMLTIKQLQSTTESSPPILHTTTTLATLTCRISSTSGCAAR